MKEAIGWIVVCFLNPVAIGCYLIIWIDHKHNKERESMKQFNRAISSTCIDCYCDETIITNSIEQAKHILKENYGWFDTVEGMICSECATRRLEE